jgi:hypothetical protein
MAIGVFTMPISPFMNAIPVFTMPRSVCSRCADPRVHDRAKRAVIDDAIRERLVTMTTDFKQLWADPATPNRERKRMLAYVVEDVTLVKLPREGTTKIHVHFRGGQTQTLTTVNPKSSAQKVKTPPQVVELVDGLLDDHVYADIAGILNDRGLRPGGSARAGRQDARFTEKRVAYLAHAYGLRSRFDRLRARGLLTKEELADRLGIHVTTLTSWVKHGIIRAHAYNGHAWLYEDPPDPPRKHCSRWDRLADRASIRSVEGSGATRSRRTGGGAV